MRCNKNVHPLFGIACFLLLPFFCSARVDSLLLLLGTNLTVATKNYQPLWLTANRYHSISDQKTDLSTFVSISNQYNFRLKNLSPEDSVTQINQRKLYLQYGVALVYNNHFKNAFFQEYFIKAGKGKILIKAGRFKEIPGEIDKDISSGSLGISGNALPIPKIAVSTDGYINFPGTNGLLQFNAQLGHGWFGNERYTKKSWLHEKLLYIRLGKKKLRLFAGIQHYVEWAGSRDGTAYNHSWKDFLNVFLGKELKEAAPSQTAGLLPNRAGDQRAVIELGGTFLTHQNTFHFYHQTPLENAQGAGLLNNRLLGFSITAVNTKTIFKKILFEYINTNQTNDNYPALYRQSFYNNGVYKTGWEYHNKIVGTPLFINRIKAQHYFTDVLPFNWDAASNTIPGSSNIYINNIVGGHAGLLLGSKNFSTKSLLSYTRNYSKTSKVYKQLYTIQEVKYTIGKTGFTTVACIAADFGELSDNTGLLLGFEWRLPYKK